MTVQIRVDASDVTEALDELDGRKSRSALQKATTAAAKFLKPKMRMAAPVGPTGRLRKSVRFKRVRPRGGDVATVVGPRAPHRHLVIQGTQGRFTKSGAYRGRMTANPFVDRVANSNEDQALRIAEEELARQLGLE